MQAKEVVRAKFAKAISANPGWGNQAVRLPVPRPSTGERGAPGLVSTSGHCHLGRSIDTIFGSFFPRVCTQSRALMPKLFGLLRAFPLRGNERTCRTQTHVHRLLNTRAWQTIRAQPANCRECSRSVHRLFIVVLCVFWGIELTQRMRCRRRCWLPTNICTSSGDSRRCPLG